MVIIMLIVQNGYNCKYELTLFYKLFFGIEEDIEVYSDFKYKDKTINVYTEIIYFDRTYSEDYYFSFDIKNKSDKLIKKVFTAACTKSFCHTAKKIRNVNLPWGVMCGIRPAKNARELSEEGYNKNEIRDIFKNVYEVSDEKTELALTVAENEKLLLSDIGKNSVSLYIGIPFCPTRCLYCSFVSTDVRVSGKYIDAFVEKLLLEIKKTAEVIGKIGAYVENIYIGGGTPTTLSAKQLSDIFTALKENFDFSKLKEFTLEAGRVDTITEEKLIAAKDGGVTRISVNPQTMNDITLKKIGRAHSADMVRECFKLARKIGFNSVNMDLIAGLPDETPKMFKYSIDEVIKLAPENITVHSMCVKRAANLRLSNIELTEARQMNEMLSYAQKRMKEINMIPYYMYRQKNILGNLENVGYAKPETMSAYNINIMEEKQTIIALGGGGSTKLVTGDKIERIFNFKDPLEYIRRFDDILKKKDEITEILKTGGEKVG